jgi:lipoprotein-releasing system permease protein
MGDPVVLQLFTSPETMGIESAAPKMVQCVVSGIYESGMYEYDASIAYIDLQVAQQLLGMGGGVTGVQAKVKDPWHAERVGDAMQIKLGSSYYCLDWKAKNQALIKWMGLEKVLFGAVISLIVVVAAFNIISSLIMLVLEKTKEIGILRAMGVSSKSVMRIFMLIGGFVGLMGSVLGTSLGVGISWAQMRWGFIKLPPDIYMLSVFPIKVIWSDVLVVFLIANAISLLVTIPPALKASKMDPVRAIRHE